MLKKMRWHFVLIFTNQKFQHTPYILIVNRKNEQAEEKAMSIVKTSVDKYIVKSKTVNDTGIETTSEIRLKDAATSFVNRIKEVGGVSGVTLVTFNGDYMS